MLREGAIRVPPKGFAPSFLLKDGNRESLTVINSRREGRIMNNANLMTKFGYLRNGFPLSFYKISSLLSTKHTTSP